MLGECELDKTLDEVIDVSVFQVFDECLALTVFVTRRGA